MSRRPAPDQEPRLPADADHAGPLPARVGARASTASFLLVAGFLLLVVCLFLFGTLAEGIRTNEVFVLDTVASPFLHAYANPVLDALMNAATFAGSIAVIPILFVVAIVALLATKRSGAALFLTLASGGALLLNGLMKPFFHRARPQLSWSHVLPDYSFPSGHTMNSVAFYVALAIVVWSIAGRRWGQLALAGAAVLCALIGISRIYLGYHYLTDVIGGATAGLAWVLVTLAAFRAGPLERLWTITRPAARTRRGRRHGARS